MTFQIQQNYPAPVGLLPEPDFCRIWKKCRIPAGAEIRYSPSHGCCGSLTAMPGRTAGQGDWPIIQPVSLPPRLDIGKCNIFGTKT